MAETIDQAVYDPKTGKMVEIVRDAETGEIIGKNERMPEEATE
jgi:hypothetical protein